MYTLHFNPSGDIIKFLFVAFICYVCLFIHASLWELVGRKFIGSKSYNQGLWLKSWKQEREMKRFLIDLYFNSIATKLASYKAG